MKILLLLFILLVSSDCLLAGDILSIKAIREDKLANDSLFFQLIDQQRVIGNDGIVKLDFFHLPSGYREQKIAWMQEGICNQFASFKGVKDGKLFIRATTTLGGIENSKSEFLIFLEDGKIISIQDLDSTELPTLKVEAESGLLLAGFSNKIAITTLNAKIGKQQKESVVIFTDGGDTLSRFTVANKRLIDIYLEEGKKYFVQTNTSQPVELKTGQYGYSIKCKQIGDSIDIEIFRGKQQPVEKLLFCLQVNNYLDTIANFEFEDTLFVMNERFYWPPTRNQYISFLLMSNRNIVMARRYWENDTALLKQSPFFTKLNTSKINIDSSFEIRFSCKGCDREKITYQVTDKDNVSSGFGQVQWLSDSLFAINSLQLVGKGYLALSIDRNNMNWKPIIQSVALPIIKPTPIFYAKEDVTNSIVANNNIEEIKLTKVTSNNLLPEVSVTGIRKTRLEELEEKYVKNIMFKSLFSININVLDDENSRNGITLFEYARQKIPFLNIKTDGKDKKLIFRGGEVEYWIDEVPYTGSTGAILANSINPSDVAYIKLLKNSIRGLGGGSGALLIYTKKGNEKELDKRFYQRVAIEGIQILEF